MLHYLQSMYNDAYKAKNKIYKTIIKPAMIYESECWAVENNDTHKLPTVEIKMRWARGKTKGTMSRMKTSGEKPSLNQ